MTVSSVTSRVSYAGDGTTTGFAVSFYIPKIADLKVATYNTVTGAIINQVLTTNYTFSGTLDPDFGYNNGGTVTMLIAPVAGITVVIYLDPSALQSLSLPRSGPFSAKPIEAELDFITRVLNRVKNVDGRVMKLPDGFGGTFDPTIPLPLTANTVLAVNAGVTAFTTGPTITDISNAATNATAAASSASAAAGSAVSASASATQASSAAASTLYISGGTVGGTGDAITLTPSPAITSYVMNMRVVFTATASNTTAATVNISGLGVKSIKTQSGATLSAAEITSGRVYNMTYDGTNFVVAELSTPEDGVVSRAKLTTGAVGNDSITAIKTATYAILTTDDVVQCNVNGGAFTATLPTAVGASGRRYKLIQTGALSVNALTLATTSSQTIGGISTRRLYSQGEMMEVESDGANWFIVYRYIPSVWVNTGACTVTATTTAPTKGTFTLDNLWVRREGDSAHFRYESRYTSAGTAGSGDYLFGLPAAYPLDSTKVTFYTTVEGAGGFTYNSLFGTAAIGFQGSSNGFGAVIPFSASQIRIGEIDTSGASTAVNVVCSASFAMIGTSGNYAFDFVCPISGWEG